MEKIELAQVRDMGQIIGDPFLFVRTNFKLLLRAFLYYAVPPLVVAVGLSAFGIKSLLGQTGGANAMLAGYSGISSLGPMVVFGYILFILTSVFQQIYISEFMILKETKDDVTNAEVLDLLKNDWKIILLTFGVMIPIGIAVGVALVLLITSAQVLGAWVAGLAVFVLYLFVIYSVIPLMNILFVRLRERLGIIDSLAKCFRITSGNWWRTFIAWFVLLMIFYMLMIVIFMPFGVIFTLLEDLHRTYSGSSPGVSINLVGIALTLSSFAFFFIMNLVNVFIGINYFSLSERYDNYHLKAEIEQIGEREDRNIHRQEGEY